MEYTVERINFDSLSMKELPIFLSRGWSEYICKDKNIESVVLRILLDNDVYAFFIGGIIKIGIFRILASPFEGWFTPRMGFVWLNNRVNKNDVLRAVAKYAFSSLKCIYFQVTDSQISFDDIDNDINYRCFKTLVLNMEGTTESLYDSFSKDKGKGIKKSEKRGTIVEQVPFDHSFVDVYYDQILDVFEKQGLKPTYDKERIYKMSDYVDNNKYRVYAVVARVEGSIVASAFSLGDAHLGYIMGTASYRKYQKYYPNELLYWDIIQYWKSVGVEELDFVGFREDKLGYGTHELCMPTIYFERIPGLYIIKEKLKAFLGKKK